MTNRKVSVIKKEKLKLRMDKEAGNIDVYSIYTADGRVPDRIHAMAHKVLRALVAGEIMPKAHVTGNTVSLPVGRRYRLIRHASSPVYILCSHAKYDTLRKRK